MLGNSFYSKEELKEIGFHSIGEDVLISRYARIYGANKISIGNHVRIDDFCILSGKIQIGNYVHIAAACLFFAGNTGILLEDYVGVSSRSALYAASDDYSGEYMTNPTVPLEYKNVIEKEMVLKKHVLIGTNCTILPGVTVEEGTAVGAMSLINKNLESWGIYIGTPCKKVKNRSKKLLDMESKLEKESIHDYSN